MPKSSKENKEQVKLWYEQLKPRVVVDVGPGQGTYSQVVRDNKAYWVCVEAWAPYVEQFNLNKQYDEVIISDINYVDLNKVHHSPDLVIIGDVLEHMTKSQATQLISNLMNWSKHVIISIPLKHLSQGPWQGNYFETHIDHWNHNDMVNLLGIHLKEYKTGKVLGYYLCAKSV